MSADPQPLAFYGTRLGAVAARLLRARIAALWPEMSGRAVLGIGHAAPYLRLWRDDAARCIAAVPAALPAARWPTGVASRTVVVEEELLPLPDLAFDCVLLVHGLETAGNARRLLREVWRVLRDDGRLLVVAPNRRGLWAHAESTPFGQGHPYSSGQLTRLLAATMFEVERRDEALHAPPLRWRAALRSAGAAERVGRRVLPGLGGVTLAEARKNMYAAVPLEAVAVRRSVVSEAA